MTQLFLDEKEIMVTATSDLAMNSYELAEESMDEWIETHKRK